MDNLDNLQWEDWSSAGSICFIENGADCTSCEG